MKLFGLQIVYGFSPEARVFASLLGNRPRTLEPAVLMHDQSDAHEPAQRFAATAKCEVIPFDTGWRLNTSGKRAAPDRVLNGLRYWCRLPRIAEIASTQTPDVVYSCQQHYDCRAATYVARRLQRPQVIHLHYIIGPWLKRAVLRRLLTCDHVIAVSDFIRDEALRYGVPPERVTTVRNAMSPFPLPASGVRESMRREIGVPHDAMLYGIVSRLDPGKGHADTISAFGAAAVNGAWLVIVGAGSLDAELRAQASRLPCADRILFTGRRSDVPSLLAAMDAFVHPSRLDPCPLAVLEAMSAGLPVIAYAEGGAVEMIDSEKTGWLAPAGDVDGLAQAIRAAAADLGRTAAMGDSARRRVADEFRPEDAGAKFAEVLGKLA